ncbi:unnamed protein product [Lactuca saligna]|uniref:Uncharacterized protein n=1 Tax=Lactuca saligna TaxID=75948 RepID=A0AA36EBL9_LACSI|nr:unnamed protein product [Lactuca saligna]
MADDYSGSDLKNLSLAAANHPIKEILENETKVSWTLYKLCVCGVRLTWHSLSHGLSIFQEGYYGVKDTLKLETNAESSKGETEFNEPSVIHGASSCSDIAPARKDINIVWYMLFNSPMTYCVNLTNFLVTK